jgi:hypothetical protein
MKITLFAAALECPYRAYITRIHYTGFISNFELVDIMNSYFVTLTDMYIGDLISY